MTYRTLVLTASLTVAAGWAFAQSADAAYCSALSAKYREFVGSGQTDATAATAMAQCSSGNTAAGIPVLEKTLKDAKVALPPRQ
jgi:hypothetical protein